MVGTKNGSEGKVCTRTMHCSAPMCDTATVHAMQLSVNSACRTTLYARDTLCIASQHDIANLSTSTTLCVVEYKANLTLRNSSTLFIKANLRAVELSEL